MYVISVSNSTGWVHHDAADAISVTVVGDLDVAVVSPGGGPGVLDEEVVLAAISSVSDGKDTVVEVGSALGAVEDSTAVELEDELVSFDGNSGWGYLDGGLKCACRSWSDVDGIGALDLTESLSC